MADRFFLRRFKNAQYSGFDGNGRGTYEQALAEIRNGRKTGHWMWYIFPQIVGFGHSHNTNYYAIKSVEEAKAYLADEVLSSRLRELCEVLLSLETNNPGEVFGFPDWLKLGSSMTLFDYVSPDDIFDKVLRKFFAGNRDLKSISIIRNLPPAKDLPPAKG